MIDTNCHFPIQIELLEKYLLRRLDSSAEQALEVHILDCPRCARLLEDLLIIRVDLAERTEEIRAHSLAPVPIIERAKKLASNLNTNHLRSVHSVLAITRSILARAFSRVIRPEHATSHSRHLELESAYGDLIPVTSSASSLKPDIKPLSSSYYADALQRINSALFATRSVFARFPTGEIQAMFRSGRSPAHEAYRSVEAILRLHLLRAREGWLSEECASDFSRLGKRVWIVNAIDGMDEFATDRTEFCVSIGFVENGQPIAGGIYVPRTNQTIIGVIDAGVLNNGKIVEPSDKTTLVNALIPVRLDEATGRKWQDLPRLRQLNINPTRCPISYNLALVAIGSADATLSLSPLREWHVAAGAALVASARGFVTALGNARLSFNGVNTLISGLMASAPGLREPLLALMKDAQRSLVTDKKGGGS